MRALLILLLLIVAVAPASARSVAITDHARSMLIAENDAVAPGGSVTLVFSQQLQDGWHVYWKNPGDSGLPLSCEWTLPAGFAAGEIAYPAPHRIPVGPLVNFGHEGEPKFLVDITAPASARRGDTARIELSATWLICADICVPETAEFTVDLPIADNPAANREGARLAVLARDDEPVVFPGTAKFSLNRGDITIDLAGADKSLAGGFFFPDLGGVIEPAAPQQTRSVRGGLRLVAQAGYAGDTLSDTEILRGVVAGEGEGGPFAYEVSAVRGAGGAASTGAPGLAGLLLAAFLGGALLNLMPCVFPILFVKAAHLAEVAGKHHGVQVRHGILYTLGVVATFLLLGAVLLALRAGGESLGWGFHLQSPVVVSLSAFVLFAVGLNFAGVFSIGESLQGVGSGLAGRSGDLGSFLTGALAVFVAAPCVGPFLTAPVGAAAVLPALPALSIFLAMGLGLAAPYLMVSTLPGLSRRLPKPGPWMARFRLLLAFPVFAASAFFVWVLAQQTGGAGLAAALAGLVLIALAAVLWTWAKANDRAPLRVASVLVLAAVAGLLLVVRSAPAGMSSSARNGEAASVAFDPADIEARRAAGERSS
ncbi:MAG: protein-disulfide reductase DsbD family protein [Parvularculaceae bacterium]